MPNWNGAVNKLGHAANNVLQSGPLMAANDWWADQITASLASLLVGIFFCWLLRRELIPIARIQHRLAHIRQVQHLACEAFQTNRKSAVRRHTQLKHRKMAFESCGVDDGNAKPAPDRPADGVAVLRW